MKKFLLVLLLVIVLGGAFLYFYLPSYLSKTTIEKETEFVVSEGSSFTAVANKLKEQGLINSAEWFKLQGKDIATKIKPGTYLLEPEDSFEDIFEKLQQGEKEDKIVLTIPEGFTLNQIAQRVESLGISTKEDFIEETENYYINNLKEEYKNEKMYFSLEGHLFPDTYHFTSKNNVKDVVNLLADTMEKVWNGADQGKAEGLGFTKHEVLTIASLIEREAYNDEERARIAGVIYNRIKIGMPLQIDASVIYAKGKGREHQVKVLLNDLKIEDPYNTYVIKTLPPGPIASPGKKSIEAALNPETHDYYYYVMGENGHDFSKTFDEHVKKADKYRKSSN